MRASFRHRVFVVMPFGMKEVPKNPRVDATPAPEAKEERLEVDFDAVYQLLFKPALEAAGLQPFRADDEESRQSDGSGAREAVPRGGS